MVILERMKRRKKTNGIHPRPQLVFDLACECAWADFERNIETHPPRTLP